MNNYINSKSLKEKNDSGNVHLRFSGLRSAVTRNIPAGDQHGYSRLSFSDSCAVSTYFLPSRKLKKKKDSGGDLKSLDLFGGRWIPELIFSPASDLSMKHRSFKG
jgi:hypothetical protein